MAARTNEGHMDFQYNNETGPIGADSPFAAYANTKQPWQTDSMAKKRTSQTKINVERPGPLTRASLGPFDSFDSPIKSQSAPIRFRPPRDDQSFHFSPSSPNRLPRVEKDSFITPRKAQPDVPSSEPETSPDNNADSEATPDSSARPISRGKAENSGPLRVFKGVHGSPGRGEIARGSNSSVLRHRVSKNKRLKADPSRWLRTRRDSSASDDFDSDSPQNCYTRSVKSSSRSAATASGPVASFIGFIDAHPSLPHTLSFYAQLFLNVFLVLFFIYIIYSFWATIRADVDKKSEEAAADILAEMAACTKSYRENDCGLDKRVPALESICANWERCMKRDPRSVGRARVSAHTFAEIFNSFIEPISVKAMVFSIVLTASCFFVSNLAFSLFRNKASQLYHTHHPAQQYPNPQTPHHYSMGLSPSTPQQGWPQSGAMGYQSNAPSAYYNSWYAMQSGHSPSRSPMQGGLGVGHGPESPNRGGRGYLM